MSGQPRCSDRGLRGQRQDHERGPPETAPPCGDPGLLTLYAVLRSDEAASPGRWSVVAVVSCVLGMVSKEVMAAAPIIVLLYDRAFLAGSFAAVREKRGKLYLALFATWIVLLLMIASSPRGQSVGFDIAGGPMDYLEAQCTVLPIYLRSAFWPALLVFDYGILLPVPMDQV